MFIGFLSLIMFKIFLIVSGLKYNLFDIEKLVEMVFGLLFMIIVL